MRKKVKVWVNKWKEVMKDGKCVGVVRDGRMVLESDLIEKKKACVIVRLPDGNIIRRRNKDIYVEGSELCQSS